MRLFHGSKQIIKTPLKGGSHVHNDYGPSFYTTKDKEQAKLWACKSDSVGFVNEYEIAMEDLRVLDLTDKTRYSVLNWIAILLNNRQLDQSFTRLFSNRIHFIESNYLIDVNEYDVVKGYRADDAYFRFPLDFIRGNLTLEQLERVYLLGELGIQYAIMSEKAISKLVFKSYEEISNEYIGKYYDNIMAATKVYDSLSIDEEGTRIQDLMKGQR